MKLIAVSTRDSEGSNILSLFKTVSPLGIIGYIIGILFIRWVLRGLHRIYFHPLRKFPGPKLSAFTRIPHIRAVCKGELHKYVARLHETYGEVVRISPDELSFVHPQVWQDIYGRGPKEGKGSAPPKDWSRQAKPVNGVPPIISIPDNARHARTRKIFSPAFSDRALAQQAPLFNKYADKLVDCLRAGGSEGRKFDMVRMWNFVSFDIMGDLTFGESLHMLDSAQYDPWVQGIFRSVKVSVRLGILYFYYPLAGSIIRKFLHRLMAKKAYEHHNHSAMRVTKRLEKGRASEGIDLWDLVLQHQEKDKTVLSRPEMDSNANLFMLAGTETTATAMSALTYLLLKNPRTMETLVNEIRDTFENPSQVTMDKVQALPYLNACIKEALRVHAAVPAGQPHRTPKEGSTVCGRYVPPDVVVAGHHWVVYRSPSLWTDPTKFAPERWMGDVRYTNDQLSSVQAFSTGPRDCLGKNMAMHEMRLLVTKVLYNFDLSLCPESEGWSERQKLWVLWEKIPLMVEVKDARRE